MKPKRKYTRRKVKAQSTEDIGALTVMESVVDSEPRQCYGPQCIELARDASKYCSDECGMKLATAYVLLRHYVLTHS